MDRNIAAQRKTMLEAAARRLRENGFTTFVADDAPAAAGKALEIIMPEETVGVGGSQTVRQLAIIDRLLERGQKLLYPRPGMSQDEMRAVRHRALTADVFVASPNAVTRDGKLVFVDKIGNRAAAMFYGPKKVIAIAGSNKIVSDEAAAWDRIDNFAAPVNARRLNIATPCVQTGVCADCDSKDRICNIAVTLMKKPSYTDYYVLLVPEDLGY